ncbi:hypothetical protein FALBO_5920 [Fusarium albosuccineum]|uniref:Uncharacterized protein n=1 Tax=Fusarium albosuccineum TaxID=1237068 RepID=A0A8H4PF30_9HYPO|nr:hypothetical protein FALBO_5920 [Fusarium albosuccineum]
MASTPASSSRHEVHVQHDPPLIRLQVWCYSELGRDLSVNCALAASLSGAEVDNWLITPARPSESPESSTDRYAPIEASHDHLGNLQDPKHIIRPKPLAVECQFQPSTDCEAEGSLRKLFRQTLPPLIDNFSKGRGLKPLQITMFPVGGELPDDAVQRYSHAQVLHSLAMDHTRVAHASNVRGNQLEGIARTLAAVTPEAVVAGLDLSVQIKNMVKNSMLGESPTDDWLRIKAMFSEIKMLDDTTEVLDQAVKHESSVDLRATPEIRASWNMVLASSYCFRKLVGDLQECISKISKGSVVGNEDLYCIVIGMTVAMNSLSWHRKEMKTFGDLVCKEYGETKAALWKRFLKTSISFVAGVVLASATPVVGGVTTVTASTVGMTTTAAGVVVAAGAAGLASSDIVKKWKLGTKMNEVEDLQKLRRQLELGGAQIAVAAIFCGQVLSMRLDLMSRTDRKCVLQALGVDVDELKEEDYRQELVLSRIRQFCSSFEEFDRKRQEVGDEFGIRDVKEAKDKGGKEAKDKDGGG